MSWLAMHPNKIYFGPKAVEDSADSLAQLGKKALIVMGQGGSARRNGALHDLCRTLQKLSIPWEIFEQVEANPSIDTIRAGAALARESQADFIVGIGGGSPLDAAKAIAILAVNELDDDALINVKFENVLPVAAIPTTAGTGSEVTPYAILTFPSLENKKNVASPKLMPQLAILDPAYTRELPRRISIDTAVDAYSHALESFLSARSTPLSEIYAREALHILGHALKVLSETQEQNDQNREALLHASMLAGMAISITGVTIPHAMGYYLTYFKGVTHGRANGMIMPAFMDFNFRKSADPKVSESLNISGFSGFEHFRRLMGDLCGPAPVCSPEDRKRFVEHSLKSKNLVKNLVVPDRTDLQDIIEFMLDNR